MGLTLFFSKGLDTDIMLKPDVCTISSMKHGQALHLLVLCLHEERALRGVDLYWISQEKNSHLSLHLGPVVLCLKLVAGTNTRGRRYMIGNHTLLSFAKLYKMLYIVLYCTKACNIVSVTSCNTQGH